MSRNLFVPDGCVCLLSLGTMESGTKNWCDFWFWEKCVIKLCQIGQVNNGAKHHAAITRSSLGGKVGID